VPTHEVVTHATTLVSQKVAALFLHLEPVSSGDKTFLVPMTLPTSCRDASMGAAELLVTTQANNGDFHVQGGITPTFLVASRSGYAQQNDSRQPAGRVTDARCLIEDKSSDATLMTPLCSIFSKYTKTNNLKTCPAKNSDLDEIRVPIVTACRGIGIESGLEVGEGATERAIHAFVELIYLIQRLVDDGFTFRDLYNDMAEALPAATSRFKSSTICAELNRRMASSEDDDDVIERCHWLALSMLIQQACPTFISPVVGANQIIAAVLTSTLLKAEYGRGDMPYLTVIEQEDSPRPTPARLVSDSASDVKSVVTAYAPIESTAESLDEAVRHLYQKSLIMAETANLTDGAFEDSHR